MSYQVAASLRFLEESTWSIQSGPSINPVSPNYFNTLLSTSSDRVVQIGHQSAAYAGALAKNTAPLVFPASSVSFMYSFQIDSATLSCGQVVETDMKITDPAGYTYDGSFQFNISKNWEMQVGNPWQDTGSTIPPPIPNVECDVVINYALDYSLHTITILTATVNGKLYPIKKTFTGAKVGWAVNTIVTQLQLCTNGMPGGYSVTFYNISYELS